ncbi:hypothetical protein ACROYT_G002965 [Oculina patagonica]
MHALSLKSLFLTILNLCRDVLLKVLILQDRAAILTPTNRALGRISLNIEKSCYQWKARCSSSAELDVNGNFPSWMDLRPSSKTSIFQCWIAISVYFKDTHGIKH